MGELRAPSSFKDLVKIKTKKKKEAKGRIYCLEERSKWPKYLHCGENEDDRNREGRERKKRNGESKERNTHRKRNRGKEYTKETLYVSSNSILSCLRICMYI